MLQYTKDFTREERAFMDNDSASLIKIFITDTCIKVLQMHVFKHSHVQVDICDSALNTDYSSAKSPQTFTSQGSKFAGLPLITQKGAH